MSATRALHKAYPPVMPLELIAIEKIVSGISGVERGAHAADGAADHDRWRGLDACVSEGLRAALTPALPHMSLQAISEAFIVLTPLFTSLGLRTFLKRAVS